MKTCRAISSTQEDSNMLFNIFYLILFSSLSSAEIFINPSPQSLKRPYSCSGLDIFEAMKKNDIKCLLRSIKNMDVNEKDSNGNTGLHHAVIKKSPIATMIFILNGADLNSKNHQLDTPLDLAIKMDHRNIAHYLQKVQLATDRLKNSIERNEPKMAFAAIKSGASLGTRDNRLDSLLHLATQLRLGKIVKLLIENGAEINVRNYLGETPLHVAARTTDHELIVTLLTLGANIHALDERGISPLDVIQDLDDPTLLKRVNKYLVDR